MKIMKTWRDRDVLNTLPFALSETQTIGQNGSRDLGAVYRMDMPFIVHQVSFSFLGLTGNDEVDEVLDPQPTVLNNLVKIGLYHTGNNRFFSTDLPAVKQANGDLIWRPIEPFELLRADEVKTHLSTATFAIHGDTRLKKIRVRTSFEGIQLVIAIK